MTRASMPAAVFADVGRLEVADRPVPRLERPEEVVLDVEACGVCGTDLHILEVPPGHPAEVGVVLGHEIVGVVSEAGADVTSLRPGERVAVAPNVWCGHCAWCRRGLRQHCENVTTIGIFVDGGLAPHVRVPARACYPVSADLPAHVAALAEPLSTVVHGARRAAVFPGETATVLGAGPVGLMFTALFRAAGARVLVVEPAEDRRALAAETTPTISGPRMRPTVAGCPGGTSRMWRSVPQIPQASTSRRTSSGRSTRGTGRSATSSLPTSAKTAAGMVARVTTPAARARASPPSGALPR